MDLFPDLNLLLILTILFLLHRLYLIFYNLYLSPLAPFPGPKLAAISYLPEFHHNFLSNSRRGGQFPFAVRKWHDQYGPIIRINPHELHVRDAQWFDTLYNTSRPAWKMPGFGLRFRSELSSGGTEDPMLFRARRAALNPSFSRRKVMQDVPRLQENAARVMERIGEEFARQEGVGKLLNLNGMWGCFAVDNLINSCFDQDQRFIESPDFSAETNEAMVELLKSTHVFYHFPVLMSILRRMPDWLVVWMNPNMAPLVKFWSFITVNVKAVLEKAASGKEINDGTIFSSLLKQDLPPEELSFQRLHQESLAIIGAGVETTARSLTLACFHIIDQPGIFKRLTAELHDAMPDPTKMPDWNALVKLPYLSACIDEAVRLTYGVSQRRTRAFLDGPLTYKDWTIPPGVFVGMDNWDVAHDEAIFPNSHSFVPERWLDDPVAPDGRPLKVYQTAFGKGTRSCIGIQLAYAELYIGLAHFFRSPFAPRVVIYESDKSDVELVRDHFVPRPAASSKGVRLTFKA